MNTSTHTYPQKLLIKIKWLSAVMSLNPGRVELGVLSTSKNICNHQADSPRYIWPDVWSGDLQA